MVILVFASLLRFINLSHPQAYIFDEVYHGFTAREYLNNHVEAWEWWTKPPEGVAYEWTHPPVAKYGMVLGMLILGEGELGYRVGSAVMGVLGILGLYLFVKRLTNNNNLALLSAFLMTIEGTHIAQSRIAMNDSYMLTYYIWSLYAAVKSRWKMVAILYGLSLGSKWSALYGSVPLVLLYSYNNSFFSKQNFTHYLKHLLFAIRYVLIALAVYVLTFAPFILAGHTWAQWWELHRQMWYYHTTLVATHGYQSTPLQWIFGARPVWYWVQYGEGVISNIYVHANPLILWLGLVALILQLPLIRRFPYFLLYTLYFILFLPWVISPRIMFYYHYLPSAIFLLPILASWLLTLHKKIIYLSLFTLTLSLLFVSPMLYGYPLPVGYWDTLFKIFPTWK
jgi:dolichyl-phosphate-mannose--protein O-mannosyl transferase